MLNRILVVCVVAQLAAVVAFADTKCGTATLRTPGLYFEHTGDEDKPFDPLIIATSQPGSEEIHCAVPRTLLMGSRRDVFVVKKEEFARAIKLLNRNVPTHKPDPHADFQYVLVSKSGTVGTGPFNDNEAVRLFLDLAKYFERRQPDLQRKLAALIRRLGGPEQPSAGGKTGDRWDVHWFFMRNYVGCCREPHLRCRVEWQSGRLCV